MSEGLEMTNPLAEVVRYHQQTKHHYHRFARSLGYLDWANQPDPFRRYEQAPLVPLLLSPPEQAPASPGYDDMFQAGAVAPVPLSLRSLSRFLEYALALTAWKQAGGTRWALRSNPSSGNLHPTEGYVLIGAMSGLADTPGLYHYAPLAHALERRAESTPELFARIMASFPPEAFLVGLSSVHWREAWKYGERAFRYCQHDVGHAIGAIRIAAATLGWKAMLLNGASDATIEMLLGLNREADFAGAEREHPDCLMAIWPAGGAGTQVAGAHPIPLFLDEAVVREQAGQTWLGKANRLSPEEPLSWEIIEEVTQASRQSDVQHAFVDVAGDLACGPAQAPHADALARPEAERPRQILAGQVIRQRRSAVAFDGQTSISARRFFQMLARLLPHAECSVARRPMPWDALPWDPKIHLFFFVHRVEGLAPGLYALIREPSREALLKPAMHARFVWRSPAACPRDLPLFLLEEEDVCRLAAQVSCGQEIAGDSCFSLGMVAEFQAGLREQGAWFYRRLFWETGLIGQLLYLEAEAAGLRGTGIGCFFDDAVHAVFGFPDSSFQSLYHFTVGGPVDDPRLTTLPPYGA